MNSLQKPQRDVKELEWALCWKCGADYDVEKDVRLGHLGCGHIICSRCVRNCVADDLLCQTPGMNYSQSSIGRKKYMCPHCLRGPSSFHDLRTTMHFEFLQDPFKALDKAVDDCKRIVAYRNRYHHRRMEFARGRQTMLKRHLEEMNKQNKDVREKYMALHANFVKVVDSRKQLHSAYNFMKKKNQILEEKLKKYETPRLQRADSKSSTQRGHPSQLIHASPAPSGFKTPSTMADYEMTPLPRTPVPPALDKFEIASQRTASAMICTPIRRK